jgi:hypothetical protein
VYPFGAKPDGDGDYPIFKWNPLHDDGDALRLAVKLRLSIDHNHPADQQHWVSARNHANYKRIPT